jgi:hypothetical protein
VLTSLSGVLRCLEADGGSGLVIALFEGLSDEGSVGGVWDPGVEGAMGVFCS